MRVPAVSHLAIALGLLCVPPARADVVHQVRTGETLASIADRYYGDPAREIVLVAANVLNAQGTLTIQPGTRIMVPSVAYYRVQAGDSWYRLAQRLLGGGSRANYLAEANNSNPLVAPSTGAVLRIPYPLRYVVLGEETLDDIVRQYYGEQGSVLFVVAYNRMSSLRLQRGQVVLLPMADLILRDEPVCENTAPAAQTNLAQRRVDQDLPSLLALVTHGQYVEAVAMGSFLARSGSLSVGQRVAVDRALAEAYCALDRIDLAGEAFRDALTADATLTLDEDDTSPKLLEAFSIARGQSAVQQAVPAPPTSRPDDAH